MKKYHLSATARADFYEASDYLLSKSVSAAERWEASIESALQHIADWPRSGHTNKMVDGPLLFCTIDDYIVAYHAEVEPVFILAILHGARDIPSILQERLSTE